MSVGVLSLTGLSVRNLSFDMIISFTMIPASSHYGIKILIITLIAMFPFKAAQVYNGRGDITDILKTIRWTGKPKGKFTYITDHLMRYCFF